MWGLFTLITVYQNHSEFLQLQKDEAAVNTYMSGIGEKSLLKQTLIILKMEESILTVLNADLNHSFKLFHKLRPFIK